MYLSAHEIAASREHALNNLLGLSTACFAAGQRLSEALAASSREAIHHGSKHCSLYGHGQIESLTQFPATVWLENSARTSRLLDNTLEILGETHRAMLRNAESQVRVFDQIAFATINRAVKSSPWEIAIGLQAMKTTLQAAESTLQEINAAASETVNLAGHEVYPAADGSAETRPAVRKRAPVRPTTNQ
jgi:hypothetical protein